MDTDNKEFEQLKKRATELNLDVNQVIDATMQSLEEQKNQVISVAQAHTDKTIDDISQDTLDLVWDKVQIARHADRPTTLEYIEYISDQFIELHGDRYSGDDKAMVGGLCTIEGLHFTFIGHQKGANLKENVKRNYGMAHPEGYRKALRLAQQAEHFHRPIITFIDTSGAYPGIASEERGIGEAIAKNLLELSILETPIICIVIGEGGSGGALGIGIGDKIFMLENSIYSVISPEGFASILLRDPKRSKEAAALMKMTAPDVLEAGFIDGIIAEPEGGAHANFEVMAGEIKTAIVSAYHELMQKDLNQLLRIRSQRIIAWTRDNDEKIQSGSKDFLSKIRNLFE